MNKNFPLRVKSNSKYQDDVKHVALLLLTSENEKENSHYCWIKNFSRLCSSQIDKNSHKLFFCMNCVNSFYSQELLDKHMFYCFTNDCVAIKMPQKNTFINYKNFGNQITHPAVFYADFECLTRPVESINDSPTPPDSSWTKQYQQHDAVWFLFEISLC